MVSPPRDSPTLPSSPPRAVTIPVRDGSPIRRRRSGSQASDNDGRPRLSPTLMRSLNPNDPELRERQRELDLDMAAHLSRARQNSVSISPVASPFHLVPPNATESSGLGGLAPFSEGEEREFEAARAGGNASAAHTVDIDAKSDFFSHSDPALPADDESQLHHLSAGHDPDLLFAPRRGSNDRTPMQLPPRPDSGVHDEGGEPFLPSYAPQLYESNFDFRLMEEFGREEKRRLGLDSPTGPPTSGLRWMDLTTASRRLQTSGDGPSGSGSGLFVEANGEHSRSPGETANGEAGPSINPASRIRHRKLSQSKTTPRSQRPGKKTALFEGAAGAPPPTLGTPTGQRNLPSYENVFGDRVPAVSTPGGHGHDRPYRFSFYSNAQSATIHARSLAELPAEGQSFEDLFMGVQRDPEIGTKGVSNGDGSAIGSGRVSAVGSTAGTPNVPSHVQEANRRISMAKLPPFGGADAGPGNGNMNVMNSKTALNNNPTSQEHNTWWLDVMNPTDEEMKMLAKVFAIHPLTTEDILMEETREKIELFRNYYLVCFRGFDQDPYSPTHLEPLNMYIIVFREGTLSFHFRATPHPQNVRRRIKQLKDYISVSSDWISYALIDDITDAFGPLIQSIEYEVDSIDELVLILKEAEQSDMLRRIGTCRKKVMGLLRLMGNKADVVKGLAKRCNENWRVAPTSDIGLYLSDIQDHLITMTQNLNHYEKILSRSHSNYLAQISIEMTEANNQINDVLSKMTALGTVLIPMNLVTGLWGMNVNVPGQEAAGLVWFFSILAGLVAFAVVGGYVTFRLMAGR